MKKNLLLLTAFSFGCFLNAQVFVAEGGTGDGSSWESPLGSIIDAANKTELAIGNKITVYIKEGSYSENTAREGLYSNMPDGYDVEIIGGYPADLTSKDLVDGKPCGYNPVKNRVNLTNKKGGASWFRVYQKDGNLKVKGLHVVSTRNAFAGLSPVLTLTNKSGGNYVQEDIFLNEVPNYASDPGNGGFLSVRDSSSDNTFLIKNCTVQNITEAGAIKVNGDCQGNTLTIENSSFKNVNVTSFARGGAIRVESNDENKKNILNIKNSVFCNGSINAKDLNVLSGGGVIYLQNVIAKIEDSKFVGNQTKMTTRGGVIYAKFKTEITSKRNYYANNEGRYGGVFSTADDVKIISIDDIFFENKSISYIGQGDHGGVIYSQSKEPLVIRGSKFYNNSSKGDGVIWIEGSDKISEIENVEFGHNEAGHGGAIYLKQTKAKILNCKFDNNKANTKYGGAVYAESSAVYAEGNCFTNNFASDGGSGMFIKNDKGEGIFDVPSGYTYSNGASKLRQISYNNKFYNNTSGSSGSNGNVGGALVYENIRAQSANGDDKEGNIAILANEFYENTLYYNRGRNLNAPAAGITLRGIGGGDDDNIVAFADNKFAGNKRGKSNGAPSATDPRVDVSVWNYDQAAIFNVYNNKFQLAKTEDNYPELKNPPRRDWEGIDIAGGNGNTFNNSTVEGVPCEVTDPSTGFSCPTDDFTGINPENVTIDKCACTAPPASGTPLQTKVGVSTFNRNVENWLPENLGAYIVLESSKKGFVVTRTTSDNVQNPEKGMIIWDTAENCLKLYSDKDNTGTAAWHCIEKGCNK